MKKSTWILIGIAAVIVIWAISGYNGLVNKDEKVSETFSQLDNTYKRRADLIPNVVETVKGYAKHEKEVFEGVTQARSALMGAKTVKAAAEAEATMTSALSRVFAIAEAYPQLKADSNFLKLQEQLQDVEDKIQASRRFYNAGAKELNTKIKTFPTNVINKLIGHFKTRDYFEVAETERAKIEAAPDVKF